MVDKLLSALRWIVLEYIKGFFFILTITLLLIGGWLFISYPLQVVLTVVALIVLYITFDAFYRD